MFPPIAAGPAWAAIPVAANAQGSAAICPLACIQGSADLYRLAFAQSAEAVERARLVRRILDSAASFNSWN